MASELNIVLPEIGATNSKVARKELRARLFEKQCGICAYCDEQITILAGPALATLDHVTPISRGGIDAESNIVLACWQCNRLKGNMTVGRLRRLADRIEAHEAQETDRG